MTSSLRRKRRTTPRGPSRAARTPASLLALLCLAAGAAADGPTRYAAPAKAPTRFRPIYPVSLPPEEAPTPVRPAFAPVPVAQVPGGPDAPFLPRGKEEEPLDPEGRTIDDLDLSIPGRNELFRLEPERDFEKRLLREEKERKSAGKPLPFPQGDDLTEEAYRPRSFPRRVVAVEPGYVNYGRLLFNDASHERYGWDFAYLSPLISGGRFFLDVYRLPHKVISHPKIRYESSAGLCLPGDPVPYLAYPPTLTAAGGAFQGSVIATLFLAVP